ncbi:RHS repeat-associated core domain-containing protein [Actinomadura welshii]
MPNRPHLTRYPCRPMSLHADSFQNRRADNEPPRVVDNLQALSPAAPPDLRGGAFRHESKGKQHGGSECFASILERSRKRVAVEALQDAADHCGDDTEKENGSSRAGYGRYRLRISAPDNDILFTYNDRGLPLSSITAGDKTTQFAYDANGRLAQRTDPAGTTTLTWNGQDQIATTTDTITGGTDTRTYDDAGRLTDIATQYGATTAHRTFGYDDLDRLTTDQLKAPDGTVLASIAYTYNLDDHLTGKTTTGTAAGQNTYGYDDAGRLTSWTNPAGQQTEYGWDAAGNRTKAGSTTYTYDERNRLTSDGTNTYTYSARGTLTSDGTATLTWDAFDRLTTDGSTDYAYDGLDRVATRTQGSTTETFLYATDQNDLTAILDGSGTPTSGYQRTPAGGILGIRQNNQSYRAYTDGHDDLTALYDPGTTTLNGSTAYDPNGQPTTTNGTTSLLGYQGEYTDPGTGRVNMHARWYTPGTATFTSRDDWTLNPDPSVQANRYTYANAAPLDGTDPSGHFAVPIPVPAPIGIGVSVGPYGWAALGLGYAGYGAYLARPYYARGMAAMMAPGFSGLAPGMNMAFHGQDACSAASAQGPVQAPEAVLEPVRRAFARPHRQDPLPRKSRRDKLNGLATTPSRARPWSTRSANEASTGSAMPSNEVLRRRLLSTVWTVCCRGEATRSTSSRHALRSRLSLVFQRFHRTVFTPNSQLRTSVGRRYSRHRQNPPPGSQPS